MILFNDKKKIRMIINFLDVKYILDCLEIIISAAKPNFKYVMFLLKSLKLKRKIRTEIDEKL